MIVIMAGLRASSHYSRMNKLFIVLAVFAGAPASAQHQAPSPRGSSHSATSSYAGEEVREIKSLSAQEQRAWLEGQGMGLAKAAELNSYPGPMHVLEHAGELGLSAAQQNETRELMHRHKAVVRDLGEELVAAERQLDELFRTRRATAPAVSDLTQKVANLQGRVRASHLITHLEQTRMLRPEQVAAYDRLRGYSR